MRLLAAASEAFPQIKTRGLADVIQAHRSKTGSAFLDYSGAELAW